MIITADRVRNAKSRERLLQLLLAQDRRMETIANNPELTAAEREICTSLLQTEHRIAYDEWNRRGADWTSYYERRQLCTE